MTIRSKLSLLITLIVAGIILIAFLIVLFFSIQYRKNEFNDRLEDKALQTARLLLDVDEIDSLLLNKINQQNASSLINERLTIISDEGKILYSTDKDDRLQIGQDEIKKIKQDSIINYDRNELEVYGLRYFSAGNPYYIFIGAHDKYGKRKVANLQFTLLLTWVFCVLIMAYVGWIYSGRALRPVSNIIEQVDRISEKNIESRIFEGNGKDELARLAQTFNSMLDRLENSIKLEKTFLANASHELRNPLTAITAQLEVCLLNERNSTEYINTVKSVLEDIKSLNLLSHQLLLLTRVEAGFTEQQFTVERIDQLIFDASEKYAGPTDNFQIDYRFMQDISKEEQWKLICIRELIVIVFQNIIENAKKFGATSLLIQHNHSDGLHQITFSDNGIGISNEDFDQLFEPFFRSQNSTDREGHGVGLSLVKRIVDIHKGTVNVFSKEGKGTTLFIKLP